MFGLNFFNGRRRKRAYAQTTDISVMLFSETMETLIASNHSHALTADCLLLKYVDADSEAQGTHTKGVIFVCKSLKVQRLGFMYLNILVVCIS